MLKNFKFSIALLVVLGFAGQAEAKAKVVASFSILGDLIANVGADLIDLNVIVGPAIDAHAYEPRPVDAKQLAAADIVFANGLGFDSWIARLLKASGSQAVVIELADGIETKPHDNGQTGEAHEHDERDPHVWQDPSHVARYIKTIAASLCEFDVGNCDRFKANAEAYQRELQATDSEIKNLIGQIPAERRIVITSHDAFSYFADAYDVRFLAPEGISNDAEASAKDVAALINQIRETGATALFTETIADPRLLEQIANETGLKVGGELYSDALSDSKGPAKTYIEMMQYNAKTLAGAMRLSR
jgi:zinc/manganese transport system substrate-binding protein